MAFTRPDETDFKAFFTRDFPYGTDPDESVLDADITRALSETECVFNDDLFADQDCFDVGYLNLAAHNLVMNLRASSQGISGQFSWLEVSKAVGNVSQGFQIPQSVLDHPILSLYSKTNYGAKYLSLVITKITGQVFTACGSTLP